MIIRTVVPNYMDQMNYLGKPVKDDQGNRIGSIVNVVEQDRTLILEMEVALESLSYLENQESSKGVV